MAKINRSAKSRDLYKHLVGSGEVVDSATDKVQWDARAGEVHSDTRLEDDEGDGRPIILRQFEYRFPPGIQRIPTAEEILTTGYKKFLESQLYFVDELDLVMEPKVVINKKGFRIFATCQARKGSLVLEKPRTLKQIADGKE